MKVVDAIAAGVCAEDTDIVFCLPDNVTIVIAQALSELGVRVVRGRHEQNVVLMADGYARMTDQPGVCLVGVGPAISQVGTALGTALRRRSQVLVLTPQDADRGNPKSANTRKFVEAAGAQYVEVGGGATVAEDIFQAFRLVRLRKGPVVLGLPPTTADLIADAPGSWEYRRTPDILRNPAGVDLESDLIDEVASLLTVARTPAIIAGRGAVLADAGAVIESLADRIGAVLCTSVQARELFRNHRQNIGIVGPFGHEVTAELLQEADCVLAVGVALNPFQTGSIDGNARVIQLDVNPESFGQFSSVDYAIVADARLGVSVLDRALEAAKTRHASAWMTEAMQARVAAARVPSPLPVPTVDKDGRVPVAHMLRGLDAALPAAGRVVIMDGGDFIFNVIDEISISDPKSWVWTADFSSTGVGLGIALGVTVAAPNRECVLFVGDGGLMMSLQELETAVRERIPLIVVVLDNCAYQAEVRVMDSIGKPPTLGQFDEVDFAAIARAIGMSAVTLRAVDDIDRLSDLLADRSGPMLIDAKVGSLELHRFWKSRGMDRSVMS